MNEPIDYTGPHEVEHPKVSPKIRTAVYSVGLGVGTVAILASGVSTILAPEHSLVVMALVGSVTSATSFLAGALGVAYRPTGHEDRG